MSVDVPALAAVLAEAYDTAQPVAPLSEREPMLTLEDAYAVQTAVIGERLARGDTAVGHKVGLTSAPMQRMLGVDEPDFGVLLASMAVIDGATVNTARLIQPRAEAEIAFVMARDLGGPGVTAADALAAVAGARAAIEIIDSRVADWRITLADTVADNASSGLFVLGPDLTPVDDLDLTVEGMALYRDGDVLDTGAGAAVLGDPLTCVAWLANTLARFGAGLRAGDVVLAGALHAAVPVAAGDVLRARFTHLGAVEVRFANDERGAA